MHRYGLNWLIGYCGANGIKARRGFVLQPNRCAALVFFGATLG
jgi:hypothetical protein